MQLIHHYDPMIKTPDKQILSLAKAHSPTDLRLLRLVPGEGEVPALTILYEIHDINRFPSRGEFCSYGRLVKGQKSSAGKNYEPPVVELAMLRDGFRETFSEAAVLFLRDTKPAEKYYNRLINRHGHSYTDTFVFSFIIPEYLQIIFIVF